MNSMTGIGRATGMVAGSAIRIEIKSVNHRHAEVACRLPFRWPSTLEIEISRLVREQLGRGKIDVLIFEDKRDATNAIDDQVIAACVDRLKRWRDKFQLDGGVTLADIFARLGDVDSRPEIESTTYWQDLLPVLTAALSDLKNMRAAEGQSLQRELTTRFAAVATLQRRIAECTVRVSEGLAKKLKERLLRIVGDTELDENRLYTEVAMLAERGDITEELARLTSHEEQMAAFLLTKGEPIGRKIDFLLQEFNREFNTIASKAQDAEVARFVVDAKAELEKMREQAMNVE